MQFATPAIVAEIEGEEPVQLQTNEAQIEGELQHTGVSPLLLAEGSEGESPAPFAPTAAPPVRRVQVPAAMKAPPKVGRNDPCPCGSGRKYKKCHGK